MRFVLNLATTLVFGAALGGCSLLLDFNEAGLACDAEGQCLSGFVCTAENVCMPEGHGSTLCDPGCGELQTCVKSKCVPICDERACAAGQSCIDGVCADNPRELKLGSPCESNAECTVSGDVCLKPYGGGTGVCTRECSGDGNCDARAPKCAFFRNGQTDRGLCVNPAFKPCASEATCAASGLSCGIYAFQKQAAIEPISACRARLTGNNVKAVGEECGLAIPCANGICIQTSRAGDYRCSAPCSENAQCDDLLGGTNTCTHVTLNPPVKFTENANLPTVRPELCSPGGVSISTQCGGVGGGLGCRADAPHCVEVNPGDRRCLTACGDGTYACPAAMTCQPNPEGGPDVCVPNTL